MKKIYIIIILLALAFNASATEQWLEIYPKDSTHEKNKKKRYGTDHMFNIDIGINNYHKDGNFPDEDNTLNSVRPWGSWYIALNSIQRSHIGGSLFMEWGGGVSWYNFKFQNNDTRLVEGVDGPVFTQEVLPDLNYEKSKLTISHVNLYLVPLLQFGKNKGMNGHFWKGRDTNLGFRIGAGGYVGYRLGSHTKVKFEDESGDTKKSKDHDNFYLENLRYGVRAQLGYRGTDLFINYDMNDLFSGGREPRLSAVSFGFIF